MYVYLLDQSIHKESWINCEVRSQKLLHVLNYDSIISDPET